MSEMSYYDMNKCLCKELKCEFEKFEESKNGDILKGIKDIIESMTGLMELEAGGAMREYLEDNHGYDSRTGEFRQHWNSYPYNIYNAARPYPMTTPPYYGGEYGEYGMMGAEDGRYMNRGGRGGHGNNRGGSYNYNGDYMIDGREGEYMNDGREMYNRGRGRDGRGRYNEGREGYGIYNMANKPMKEKLSDKEYEEWVENMVGADGSRGAMWTKEQTTAVAKKLGIDFKDYDETAFWVAMNMVYSDNCQIMEKHNMDKPEVYAQLADSWLADEDTKKGAKKLAAYYECVVED